MHVAAAEYGERLVPRPSATPVLPFVPSYYASAGVTPGNNSTTDGSPPGQSRRPLALSCHPQMLRTLCTHSLALRLHSPLRLDRGSRRGELMFKGTLPLTSILLLRRPPRPAPQAGALAGGVSPVPSTVPFISICQQHDPPDGPTGLDQVIKLGAGYQPACCADVTTGVYCPLYVTPAGSGNNGS